MMTSDLSDPVARELRLLRVLESEPDLTQRQLAHRVGMSLGALNHCLNALVEKGWVKVKNFARSRNKFGYVYIMTPRGVAAKASLTSRFLARKLAEYEELRAVIEGLKSEVAERGARPTNAIVRGESGSMNSWGTL